MRPAVVSLAALSFVTLLGAPAIAAGNLAAGGDELELKIDTADLKFSQNEFDLETGTYYRLTISSDGVDSISFVAPDLWRNAWINSVSVDDVSVEATGISAIGFDDEGSAEIAFVPVRPGEYEFYAPGYENRGLKGKFVVK
ncbi:MAG TPA: hypothetical protein VFE64_17275 [Devosia sp.]|jgi:uncharacterized cupredoxin-like copper-binding protein|nr:hypothetical protein [Devosia sp.]